MTRPLLPPTIRPLAPHAVNRIAAGEVVERPASAVKELVENALDAGATRIDVAIREGGRALIRVEDDGCGIRAEELGLALARHATSKTDGADLLDIHSFGFRGEALASLAAVARLALTSRVAGAEAASIAAEGGRVGAVRPAALSKGTVIEVRDLFFATPARLKFLRGQRAEAQAVAEVIRRLAMAEPYVAFLDTDNSAAAIIQDLQLDMLPEALRADVSIAAEAQRFLITIQVDNENGDAANDIARKWAELLVQWRNDENQKQRREDRVTALLLDAPRYVLDHPRRGLNTAAGGVLGILLGGLLIFFLEYWDAGILRTRADVERQLNLAVLGTIPSSSSARASR